MGLNELAYQIFSEQMEEFATRNERMVEWGIPSEKGKSKDGFYRVMSVSSAKNVLKSQQDGVWDRGGSQDAPKYKGAKVVSRNPLSNKEVVFVPPTTSKLRAMLKHGDNLRVRKAWARSAAKMHEGAKDRRRAWNEEHQKKYLASKKLRENGYI